MRIVKSNNPTNEIAVFLTHIKEHGYAWWRTAQNGVYADDLVVFKIGDSSGAHGVLYSVEICHSSEIDDDDFIGGRPESLTKEKMDKMYHKVVGGRVEFTPRSMIIMANGRPLHTRALRTNVIIDFE